MGVTIAAQPAQAPAMLLVDIYDESERRSLAGDSAFRSRVLVDDLGLDVPAGFDAVWNPNAYGSPDLYRSFGGQVISGRDCVPIRSGLPRWDLKGGGAISCGGGKTPNALQGALAAIPALLDRPHGWAVGESVPPGWRRANEDDVWSDLHTAAWLITAAGSTVWEAAAVGIPAVVVVFADNQALVGEWVSKTGVPVVDVRNRTDALGIARDLAEAVGGARRLPHLESGADNVAQRLLGLVP
jgi:hypothetical protein